MDIVELGQKEIASVAGGDCDAMLNKEVIFSMITGAVSGSMVYFLGALSYGYRHHVHPKEFVTHIGFIHTALIGVSVAAIYNNFIGSKKIYISREL